MFCSSGRKHCCVYVHLLHIKSLLDFFYHIKVFEVGDYFKQILICY